MNSYSSSNERIAKLPPRQVILLTTACKYKIYICPITYHQSQRLSVPIPFPSETSSTSNLITTHRKPNRKILSSRLPQSRTQHPPSSGSSHPTRATLPCLAQPSSPQPSPDTHRAQNSRKLVNSSAAYYVPHHANSPARRNRRTLQRCSPGAHRTAQTLHRLPEKGEKGGWHTWLGEGGR